MMGYVRRGFTFLGCTAALLALPGLAAGADTTPTSASAGEAPREALLNQRETAIVRVEAVLKTKLKMGGQGEERESRLDVMGAVVDPQGLIMIWNSHISSSRMSEMMHSLGRENSFDVDISPTSFQVYLGDSDEGVSAFLAATDSTLDLAFLQLDKAPEKPLPYVDFSQSTTPRVGEEVLAVSRLGRSFDFAPYLSSARIGGKLAKPREAWILDGDMSTYGLPVFALSGAPVGALTTIFSHSGGDSNDSSMGMGSLLGRLTGNGNGSVGPLGTFVLPGNRVASLVDQARKRAQELLTRRHDEEKATDKGKG